MSKKKKQRRRPPQQAASTQSSSSLKRRLRAPKIPQDAGPRPEFPRSAGPPAAAQPYVKEIAARIEQVATLAQFNPMVIIEDWVGMMEASLRMWAENMRAMATTGHFAEDPPEIKAIFARARARYTRASSRAPAVYRHMQQIFSQTFALLLESAAPGLERYGRQVELNPDVIGQVFITCLQPGPDWLQFFLSWEQALATARAALPHADERVYTELAQAARRAGYSGELEPGINFESWYEAIRPYVEPVLVGPTLISSPTMLLALAAQFPPWSVQAGLVRFSWEDRLIDPVLSTMASLNAQLYGLNGYLLEHIAALTDIQTQLEQPSQLSPSRIYGITASDAQDETEPAPQRPTPPPDAKSFSDLFRS